VAIARGETVIEHERAGVTATACRSPRLKAQAVAG
jgi:hypothetical protein